MSKPTSFGAFGICEECDQENTGFYWCRSCNAKRFQQNFKNWTSNNNDIDEFIRNVQLSAKRRNSATEWIPYDKFENIERIAEGGFGNVYKAEWIDGNIREWDIKNKDWKRENQKFVILKSLNNSKDVRLKFINEIASYHKISSNYASIVEFYGLTQDVKTKDYMMVLQYAEKGSLRNYLDENYDKSNWKVKIVDLYYIAYGLNSIHENELIHCNLHAGNILVNDKKYILMTDIGLCKPADYNSNTTENTENNIYGVLPYIAPEILKGQKYTKASDIYSFGIVMYEVISGLPPYCGLSHDKNLAIKICKGLRPRFNIKVPRKIVKLTKKCLDANPLKRPTSKYIHDKLCKWWKDQWKNKSKLGKQFREINDNSSTTSNSTNLGISYEIHPDAVYKSRLLNFNYLPEPKNSDDYFEQYDNIISNEFLGSFSQLKINDTAVPNEE